MREVQQKEMPWVHLAPVESKVPFCREYQIAKAPRLYGSALDLVCSTKCDQDGLMWRYMLPWYIVSGGAPFVVLVGGGGGGCWGNSAKSK